MNKIEFIRNYYSIHKKETLYFFMRKFDLNYDIASTYLKNAFIESKTIKLYFESLK